MVEREIGERCVASSLNINQKWIKKKEKKIGEMTKEVELKIKWNIQKTFSLVLTPLTFLQ